MSGTADLGEGLSFPEPYGHDASESKLERFWRSFRGPYSLHRQRVRMFSPQAGMSFAPMQYTLRRFTLPEDLPSDDWIEENLVQFVRAEFTSGQPPEMPSGWPPEAKLRIEVPERFLEDLLAASENAVQQSLKSRTGSSSHEIAVGIYELLCDQALGSSKNRQNNSLSDFVDRLCPAIDDKSRLLFVLPGFPFKDQNRFRIPFEGGSPDLGDIALMMRLHRLALSMYQIHPYGVDVLVLTDGELYREIFGVSAETVRSYAQRLITLRNKLNLQGTVSFVDLKQLLDRATGESDRGNAISFIRDRIEHLTRQPSEKMEPIFRSLVQGMKWNSESKHSLAQLSDPLCWSMLRMSEYQVPAEHRMLWHEIDARATEAALRYSATNLFLRWTNLIERFFPGSIRGTVHPKPGQFALAGSGGAYAWNGIAWSSRWPTTIDNVEVKPWYALADISELKQVVFQHSGLPCFFTKASPKQNIAAAAKVLTPGGWILGDLSGRELSVADSASLAQLGSDDEYFSWERKAQPSSYFSELLNFRVEHYKKHGFGVHGVWIDGKLVGQVGLQVLDEESDKVEFAIFLGKEFVHKGIGSQLTRHVIRRSRELGLSELYFVVRTNNPEGMGLVQKFGGRFNETKNHFKKEANVYSIELRD